MKKISLNIFAVALVSLMSACLKDGNKINLGPGAPASPPVIQWETAAADDAPFNSNTASYREYTRTLPMGLASVTMSLLVDVTGADAAPQDITVSIASSPTAYATFVGSSTTNPILPAGSFTVPSTVTIAKGTRSAVVNITINSTALDATKNYIVPLAITGTNYGNVSGNYGTVMYLLYTANRWDGVYNYTNASTATFAAGTSASNCQLVTAYVPTTSPVTDIVTTFVQNPSYASQIWYTFNTTTNALTNVKIPNFWGASGVSSGQIVIDPISGYNPATKVIRAKYTAGPFALDETYTYVGPRTTSK